MVILVVPITSVRTLNRPVSVVSEKGGCGSGNFSPRCENYQGLTCAKGSKLLIWGQYTLYTLGNIVSLYCQACPTDSGRLDAFRVFCYVISFSSPIPVCTKCRCHVSDLTFKFWVSASELGMLSGPKTFHPCQGEC